LNTKLQQLELHERLDLLYSSGKLSKNNFSHYLDTMRVTRKRQIQQLRLDIYMKKNPVRLSKIPAGKTTLADRGFANCTMYYPNLNAQITPNFLAGREQFSAEEVSSDRVKCQLRYTSETVFSRVTDITALHDRVSRGHFSNLHHIVDWAQGHAIYVNLCKGQEEIIIFQMSQKMTKLYIHFLMI